MSSDIAKAAFAAHFAALFSAEIAAGSLKLTPLRNNENPEPPRTEAELQKTHLFVQFNPHAERASAIGGETTPWREMGVVILHFLVASGRADAAADAAFRVATNSLRNQTIGGRADVIGMFGVESGPKFGGNWWGKSIAVEYEVEDIGA